MGLTIQQVHIEIKSRKWGWIGHTLRKDPRNIARLALDYNPQEKRKLGRPKSNWRRSALDELTKKGDLLARSKDLSAEESEVEIHGGRPMLPRGPKGLSKYLK